MTKRIYYIGSLVFGLLLISLAGCDSTQLTGPNQSVDSAVESGDITTTLNGFSAGDLVAGQNDKIGSVSVTETDGTITVTYTIEDPCWCITEWHLEVAAQPEDVPTAGNSGNPVPGRFTYSGEEDCASTVTVSDIPKPAENFVVAAHAVVESDEESEFVYGITNDDGIIYAVDLVNKRSVEIFDTGIDGGNKNWPNGLAFDEPTNRLYFVKENQELYYINVSDSDPSAVLAGTVEELNAGATFYNGAYYYVPHGGDDDLHKVTFDASGSIVDEEQVAQDFTSRPDASFEFGDLAALGDEIYFHADDVGSTPGGIEFSKFDMTTATPTYSMVENGYAAKLQLAFGSDGTLYGHQTYADANPSTTLDGNFWEVMLDGTLVTPKIGPIDGLLFNDLSSSAIRCDDRSETAWAAGQDFPGSNWATYFWWPSEPTTD